MNPRKTAQHGKRTDAGLPGGRTARLSRDRAGLAPLAALVLLCSGCTSVFSPIYGIPARRLPPQFQAVPRANLVPVDLSLLRQEPPREYLLGPGDVLGVYIEGVLGEVEVPPPVHFPEETSALPPAVGFPIPVREDGTISLPLAEPILVRGLTLTQAEAAIRREFTERRQIIQRGREKILVTLVKERTYRVIVVREDTGTTSEITLGPNQVITGPLRKGTGEIVNLPAYQNDVLHALAETGGLPGLDAKNEVKIVKARLSNPDLYAAFMENVYACDPGDPCYCPPPPPDGPGVLRIPLRVPPGFIPNVRPQDVVLEDGDIVHIESREAEVFYTAGLLPAGQHPLPRDYDVTVLAAMGIAGGGVDQRGGAAGGGIAGGTIAGLGGASPTQLYILRRLPCNQQINISVDLVRAVNDPRENILVAPGDTLILRYKPREEFLNFSLAAFFTYGIQELFSSD